GPPGVTRSAESSPHAGRSGRAVETWLSRRVDALYPRPLAPELAGARELEVGMGCSWNERGLKSDSTLPVARAIWCVCLRRDGLHFCASDGSRALSTPGGLPSVVCGDFAWTIAKFPSAGFTYRSAELVNTLRGGNEDGLLSNGT